MQLPCGIPVGQYRGRYSEKRLMTRAATIVRQVVDYPAPSLIDRCPLMSVKPA